MRLAQLSASNARCCPSSRPAAPCRRSLTVPRADRWGDRYNREPEDEGGSIGGVEMSPAFASALREALERSDEQLDAARNSVDSYGWSGSRSSSRGNTPQPELTPVIQVVATALAASRQTLNRLTAERTELDSLIVKEEKQVERLEFLLEKLRSDYAYFSTLERMYEEGQGR